MPKKVLKKVLKHIPIFVLGIVFAVLCFLALNIGMEPVSTPEYCGSKCHEMNTAYQTWELSVHGANKFGYRVECVDCHLPPKDKFFTHILAKAYKGANDVYEHHFGDEYDGEQHRENVLASQPNENCLSCHDDLLKKPSRSFVRKAHLKVLKPTDDFEYLCVECHENAGHERESKLFSP